MQDFFFIFRLGEEYLLKKAFTGNIISKFKLKISATKTPTYLTTLRTFYLSYSPAILLSLGCILGDQEARSNSVRQQAKQNLQWRQQTKTLYCHGTYRQPANHILGKKQ